MVTPEVINGFWLLLLISLSKEVLSVSVEQFVTQVIVGFSFWKILHLEDVLVQLLSIELKCLCVDR